MGQDISYIPLDRYAFSRGVLISISESASVNESHLFKRLEQELKVW